VRRLVPVLLAGLLAAAGTLAPSPSARLASAASVGPRIVLIVGATHAATDSYRAAMDEVYARALQYSANVVKVYSPNATWAAVKAALQGANIVVYMGHGNGFPSPYLASLWPDRMDGFGLNAADGQGDDNTTYYGESYIAGSVRLAPNAIVILAHLCYASGNSEPGQPAPTLAVAEARIDNFAAGFLHAGARAVIADANFDTSWYLDQLFTTHQTVDQLFRSKPWAAGNTFTFASTRTPGFTDYADPDVTAPPSGFYRSMVALPTLGTDDVTGARPGGTVGDVIPLAVPGVAQVTGAGGVGLYPDANLVPDPATGAAPVLLPTGTRLRVLASASASTGGLAYRVATLDGAQAGFVGPSGLTPGDATPLVVRDLVVAPAAFSPTQAGAVSISATASKAVDWSVAIRDGAGMDVATLTASGPTLALSWGGTNAAGQPVPDGQYTLIATASDPWGSPPASARTGVTLDGTPPVLAAPGAGSTPIVLSPNGDGIDDTARLDFTLSERATVVASVRDAGGSTVRTITFSAASGPGSVAWDGLGSAGALEPDGTYTLEISAHDAAGNPSAGLAASVVLTTARSRVAASPAWLSPAGRGQDPRVANLSFTLERPASVTWQVTTAAGVPVRTWYENAPLDPRTYTAPWDGRNDAGALVPGGRYLSRVTVADGVTSTTEETPVYSGGIRILTSPAKPAAGQFVTITVVAVEALGANPTVSISQPLRARVSYRTTKVGPATYRTQVRLKPGPAGTLTVQVSGADAYGRRASASISCQMR
jgi:flagellar hook assembly protein FlgD